MYTAQAKDLKEEMFELVDLLKTEKTLTTYQKYKIALGMQQNRLYMEAHVLGTGNPSALEKLGIILENKS
jgi:hypothetical protein